MNGNQPDRSYVSRAGAKLEHALRKFNLSINEFVCADLGSSTGGFVDCLLQGGAARVHAVERGFGQLAWRLRRDPRVIVMERTDALHVRPPEPADLVTIDAGWTRQRHILPAARKWLKPGGSILSLIKPHYEAGQDRVVGGVLPDDCMADTLTAVRRDVEAAGLVILDETESPIRGAGGNREFLWLLAIRP